MSAIKEMLEFNKHFVADEQYRQFNATKYPRKKVAILSCMDTRLSLLLPAALNFKNGDVKIIKNAGALITHPFGSVMRSLIVAVYELEVEEILVIGHYDCGMQNLDYNKLAEKMIDRGISMATLERLNNTSVDLAKWLHGYDDPHTSVKETVKLIAEHPLIPSNVSVYGFVMDPETGRMDEAGK